MAAPATPLALACQLKAVDIARCTQFRFACGKCLFWATAISPDYIRH